MTSDPTTDSRPGETILLVDDEPGIRKVLAISLADLGYEVHTAADGESALTLCEEHVPAIALLDIKLPGMDGIELLGRIKERYPDTEVIMITGHGDMDLAIECIKLDAIDFITKPIHDEVMYIALKRARERIDSRNQLRQYTENLEEMVKEKSRRLVEAERLAAVGQAVEGLISAVNGISSDMEGGMKYFNDMPCFISVHNADGKVVAANRLLREKLQVRVGGNSWDAYKNAGPGDCPAWSTFDQKTGQRQKRGIRYPDGTSVPAIVYTAPILAEDGSVSLVVEIAADSSDIKRLKKELDSTRQSFRELFDAVPCYISVQDRDLRITDANRLFKEDFDFQEKSFCYEVYKQRSGPCTECPVCRTFEDGQSHQVESVVTSKNGEETNVLVWTAPLRNESGEIVQVMEMSTDITHIRRLQDHLSTLGLFVGSVSHGIKGLLTRMDGGLYILNQGLVKQDSAQVEDARDIIAQTAQSIKSMVLDILFYAKEREPEFEEVRLGEFSEEAAQAVALRCQAQEIRFTTRFDPEDAVFMADSRMLGSALVNILHNAVDACVSDSSGKKKQIEFLARADDKEVKFTVTDNGSGMDPATREKLFKLFYSSKGRKGTGLGLFIANNMVSQHQGTIKVESEPGQGAAFVVRIPRYLRPPTD